MRQSTPFYQHVYVRVTILDQYVNLNFKDFSFDIKFIEFLCAV